MKKCLLIRYSRLYSLVLFSLFICFSANAEWPTIYDTCELAAGYPSEDWSSCNTLRTNGATTFLRAPGEPPSESQCILVGTAGWTYVARGYKDCVLESVCPESGTTSSTPITTGSVSGTLSVSGGLCTNQTPSGDLCGAKCNSGVVGYNAVTGESRLECSSYTYTGSACTPDSTNAVGYPSGESPPTPGVPGTGGVPPKSPTDCPPGTGFAQINNVTTCLPAGSEYTGDQTTTTGTGGNTTKNNTTIINNDGTTTTNTTTVITDGNGNPIASGNSTNTSGIDQSGNNKSEKYDPGPAPWFDETPPEDGVFNVLTQPNPVFSTTLFQVSASCPAPITYEAMGQELTIPFDGICDMSGIIRGIILMLAAIIAIRAVTSS